MKIPWQRLHTPGAVAGDNATEENEGDTLVMKEIVPMGEVKSGRDSAEAGHASTSKPASGGHSGYQGSRVEATWGRRCDTPGVKPC